MLNEEFHTKTSNKLLETSVESNTCLVFDLQTVNPELSGTMQLNVHKLSDGKEVQESLDFNYLESGSPVSNDFVPLVLIESIGGSIVEGSSHPIKKGNENV